MDVIVSLILTVLTYTWWIILPVLLFMGVQTYRRRAWVDNQRYVLLQVSVPKENDKAPVAAEQMFAALHGIRRDARSRFFEGSIQEHIGLEIASQAGRINFYAYVPEAQKSFAEGQMYAQYPKAEIVAVPDYAAADVATGRALAGTELKLTAKDVYPIKTFLNFEDVDPLSGITAVMGDLNDGEQVWIQILARPADDSWHKRGEAELKRLQGGGGGLSAGGIFGLLGGFVGELFRAASAPAEPSKGGKPVPPPIQVDEALSSGLREKSAKLGYEVKIRIVAGAADATAARNRLSAAVGAFKQYNTTNLNGFTAGKVSLKTENVLKAYQGRAFLGKGPVLNIEELASIFHLPNTSVETPTIAWTTSSKGEPPKNLPIEGSEPGLTVFAETNFRSKTVRFGIKPDDRRRHVYAIGKTGMGKTNMLENMVLADMQAGRGLAVVDPHGDFIETVLNHIPADRVDDVIVFNPADRSFPIAFNIMEKVDRDAKPLVASGIVGVFEKIYGHSWGPRLEHILRNTILALLDYPDSTLLDVPKLLADPKFRDDVVRHIEDPVVRGFWTDEFANYTDRQRVEAIAPIQNKVGQFLSSTTIRNVLGQKHTAINLREVMDEGKILLLKLSKGELGEDASALLGAMMITKMQLAAMSRADIAENERKDFYLYVDEFQNFATESFASILSEARKYRLNLAMANQYVAQMPEEVRDAVFGNVGTIISFRVGASDATWLLKEFEPVFLETDNVNLDKYHIYLKLAVDGVTNQAFSAKTIDLPSETTNFREQAITQTRQRYANDRDSVEAAFATTSTGAVGRVSVPGMGVSPIPAIDEEDRKRRFQSYLDRERGFAEQLRTESAGESAGGGATNRKTPTPARTTGRAPAQTAANAPSPSSSPRVPSPPAQAQPSQPEAAVKPVEKIVTREVPQQPETVSEEQAVPGQSLEKADSRHQPDRAEETQSSMASSDQPAEPVPAASSPQAPIAEAETAASAKPARVVRPEELEEEVVIKF